MIEAPKAWSVKRLAAAWGIPESVVNDLVDSGRLRSFPIGAMTWRITEAEAQRVSDLLQQGVTFFDMPVVCDGRVRWPRKRTPVPVSGVYFINCGPYTKIGFTTQQFRFRLDALRTGNPFDVLLWAAVPGDFRLEKRLHNEFAEYRHRGEWFQFDAEGRRAVKRKVASLGGRIVRRDPKRTEAA